jgi:hypothetical protein
MELIIEDAWIDHIEKLPDRVYFNGPTAYILIDRSRIFDH